MYINSANTGQVVYQWDSDLSKTDVKILGHRNIRSRPEQSGYKTCSQDCLSLVKLLPQESKQQLAEVLDSLNRKRFQQCEENANKIVSQWGKALPGFKYTSGTRLPLDVWIKILELVSDDMQPDDVRGPSVVARDLSNASRTCKELYAASRTAFKKLSNKCPALWREEIWNKLVSKPDSLQDSDLRDLLAHLHECELPSRPIMLNDLYESLYLKKPVHLPARLIMAVRDERLRCHPEWGWVKSILQFGMDNSFQARALLMKLGIPTLDRLKELNARADEVKGLIDEVKDGNSLIRHHKLAVAKLEQRYKQSQKRLAALKRELSNAGFPYSELSTFNTPAWKASQTHEAPIKSFFSAEFQEILQCITAKAE